MYLVFEYWSSSPRYYYYVYLDILVTLDIRNAKLCYLHVYVNMYVCSLYVYNLASDTSATN